MAKYATAAALQPWDAVEAVATTLWPVVNRPQPLPSSTTTPTPAQEVSIFVRGVARLPKWFHIAQDALNALSALPANWNSYSARQIDVAAVTEAVELLSAVMEDDRPLPTFVPVPNGGVLLEWHTKKADLEVAVLPSGRVHVVFEVPDSDPETIEGLPQEVSEPIRARLRQV